MSGIFYSQTKLDSKNFIINTRLRYTEYDLRYTIYSIASRPPEISANSEVIEACLALLKAKVNSSIISAAASVAFLIATIREECSEASDSKIA